MSNSVNPTEPMPNVPCSHANGASMFSSTRIISLAKESVRWFSDWSYQQSSHHVGTARQRFSQDIEIYFTFNSIR
jgi:hypothetical protein